MKKLSNNGYTSEPDADIVEIPSRSIQTYNIEDQKQASRRERRVARRIGHYNIGEYKGGESPKSIEKKHETIRKKCAQYRKKHKT